MKYIEVEAFEVYSSYDRNVRHIAYFSEEKLAKKYAGSDPYKSVQKVRKTYTIFDSIEEAETYSKEEIRKKALAKLTAQEREVLGF